MIRILAVLLLLPGLAHAACRQALALGLDVSGSVDAAEYRLQLDGLAIALNSARVQEVLFVRPDAPVHVLVYEWSGPLDQTIIVPWTAIATPQDLAIVTQTLRSQPRSAAAPTTAIGSAMRAGFAYLEQMRRVGNGHWTYLVTGKQTPGRAHRTSAQSKPQPGL